MKNNKIELDLNEILVDVIKLDKNLQESIKREVRENIINNITQKFLDEYYEHKWRIDKDELNDIIVKKLSVDREVFVKKILQDFVEKLSYWSKDKRVKAYEEFKKNVENLISSYPTH